MSGFRFLSIHRYVLWIGLIGSPLLTGVVHAQTRGNRNDGDLRGARVQPFESKIGFLFIDGDYVCAPYQVESDGDGVVTVNGVAYQAANFIPPKPKKEVDVQLTTASDRIVDRRTSRPASMGRFWDVARSRDGGRRGGRFGRMKENMSAADRVADNLRNLNMGSIVLMEQNKKPLFLERAREGQEFLKRLLGHEEHLAIKDVSVKTTSVLRSEMCQNILTQNLFPPELIRRAEAAIAQTAATQSTNAAVSSTLIWNERIGYPMTILAMVLVVAAFGHLLSNNPQGIIETETLEGQMLNRKTVIHSLILVGVFSAIDLTWTLLANQSGSMRELNPLGSGMIENPVALVGFKVAITSAVIGLLYRLHRQPAARVASWWCCLILTLLTARWLTFQSMFL